MMVSITSDMFNYSFNPGMEEKLRLFADHDFDYLHWCDDWNNDVFYTREDMALYRRLVESSGLKCLDVHGTATSTIRIDSESEDEWRTYKKLLENRIEFCSQMGGDAVVVHPPRVEGEGALSLRLERSLRTLDSVKPLCDDLGIAIAVENVYRSDEMILALYFERYPPEFVAFCFDSGHANINGNLGALSGFADRLKVLHLHDNKGEKDDHQPPYWGTIDWGEVMGWIGGSGYGKPLNFEIAHDPELFEGTMEEYMEHSVASIRKVLDLLDK
jgi:sugar phosphate isomerase/epimerase